MTMQNDTNHADTYSGKERRTNSHLRGYFEAACHITKPLLDTKQGFDGRPLTLSALHALREHFPDLPQQDISILFSAVKAFHKTRLGK
ncbi:MAG: hypothetical protein A3B82_00665 [Methylophilales bacterium RIFCSPHIGHO2_02_FULL_57_10]|nr:MAG: hypothetical protein A3B82_00665 [Methylophilales bacterium RIFCSPHIGHO2_02_FULL_57_10]